MDKKQTTSTEVVLKKDEARFREEIIGTNGQKVWMPTVNIGGTNKLMANIENMLTLGWTKQELDDTAKYCPRLEKADGTGSYKFVNGCSYRGFGSMYTAVERQEEKARHKGTSVVVHAPVQVNKEVIGMMEFVPTDKWDKAIETMKADENTRKYLGVIRHLRELKADSKIMKVFEEFADIFTAPIEK